MKNKFLTVYFIITIGIFLMGAASWKTELIDVLQDLRNAITGNENISNRNYEFHIGDLGIYKFDPVNGDTWVRIESSKMNGSTNIAYKWHYILTY